MAHRFKNVDIAAVTLDNVNEVLPESLFLQLEFFLPPEGSFDDSCLQRYLTILKQYEEEDENSHMTLANRLRLAFQEPTPATICGKFPQAELPLKRRLRCVAEYLIRSGELDKVKDENGKLVNLVEVSSPLENPHIIQSSFISNISVFLNYVNGIITVPAGTELNYDFDGDGVNDGYKIVISYIYRISNKPGDDTTLSSGRVTIHYQRGIYATDQFDTTQVYPLNCTLYVGLDGHLTSKQPTENHPGYPHPNQRQGQTRY